MNAWLKLSACALVVVLLVHVVTPLPPDFFRNGRAGDLPGAKRTSSLGMVEDAACRFCAVIDPALGYHCRSDIGNRRALCLQEFANEMKSVLEKLGLK